MCWMGIDDLTAVHNLLTEWLEFYKKSLKDAVLEDVLQMLNQMKEKIAEEKKK